MPPPLPFLAGPLVPPGSPHAAALVATDVQRLRLALAVLRAEREANAQLAQPISKLTALMADGALGWTLQAPQCAAQPPAVVHPASALLRRWHDQAGSRGADREAAERNAVDDFCARLDNRWQRGRDTPLDQLPWRPQPAVAAPAPTPAGAGPAMPVPATARAVPSCEVDAVLARSGGGWALLGCLFLKLLHGQLAWLPDLGHKPALRQALYDPVLVLLQRLARSTDAVAHAPTAAGLLPALPGIAPYWAPAEQGAAWRPIDLPACFLPEWLGSVPATLRQARRLLAHRPGLAAQVDAVHALAQDVAAGLTDLSAERLLGLAPSDHAHRCSHLQSGAKRWSQALKKGEDIAALRVAKNLPRDELLDRADRLRTLAAWMAARGWRFAHEAARADGLQPASGPTPQPAPARLLPGDMR